MNQLEKEQEEALEKILERVAGANEVIANLADRAYTTQEVRDCNQMIKEITEDYQKILKGLSEENRDLAERRFGRVVTDMRRNSDWLPRLSGGGDSVPLATDDSWLLPNQRVSKPKAPANTFLQETRSTTNTAYSVGGEVEAWCGPCKGIMYHTIVAMVGEELKQVLCQSCGAQHKYRNSAPKPRKKTAGDKQSVEKLTTQLAETRRREKERTALHKELSEATKVRTFSRRARYKAGEIIEHPDYGRGKIENVLKGSLLVRFRNGLKPVSTV